MGNNSEEVDFYNGLRLDKNILKQIISEMSENDILELEYDDSDEVYLRKKDLIEFIKQMTNKDILNIKSFCIFNEDDEDYL